MARESAYESLVALGEETGLVADASALLSWDQEVLLPPAAVAYRGRQMAWFGGWLHDRFTDPKVGEWIAKAEASSSPADEIGLANLREWRHRYDRETKLPKRLVEEFAEARSLGQAAWAEARKRSDFSLFAPHLERLVGLCREEAECVGAAGPLYDALLDKFERGATTERLDRVLGELRERLVPIVSDAVSRSDEGAGFPEGNYPVAAQEAFNREVAESIGFDFDAGRIDTAIHPFCSGMGPRDVRLTTRYDESDFRSSLFGVLHEAGHGLYEQGLPAPLRGLPAGGSASLGVHESQSRLWENHVGRSLPFWEKWLPRAQEIFPCLEGISVETMCRSVNQARLTHIRVESDEVTYDLHVLLRYEMEKAIFAGQIPIADIPGEWNERFESLFGVPVTRDAEGCLQDIHWSMGIFGYFPTYSLGNINAAHLAAAARKDAAVREAMGSADYGPLLAWMRQRIHERGSILLPDDLVTEAAGEAASADALVVHLRERYLP